MAVTPSASYSLTLRIELENEPGTLGDVTSAIGEAGGSVGAIDIVKAEDGKLVRDITVDARSQENWDQILDGKTLPLYNQPRESAWYHWAQGLAHASRGDVASAETSYQDMQKALDALKSASSIPPQLEGAQVELEGLIQVKKGKREKGIDLLRKAARMEAELLYTEPPAYPRPALEMLGKTALLLRDFKEAEAAYRQALDNEPGSGRALWGIAQALNGASKRTESDKAYAEFVRVWKTADSDLPEMNSRGEAESQRK